MPSPLLKLLNFFTATNESPPPATVGACTMRALYTRPYVPSPIFPTGAYFSEIRLDMVSFAVLAQTYACPLTYNARPLMTASISPQSSCVSNNAGGCAEYAPENRSSFNTLRRLVTANYRVRVYPSLVHTIAFIGSHIRAFVHVYDLLFWSLVG